MVPRVKDNNSLGTQKNVSLDFEEELDREADRETSKFHNLSFK